MKRRTLIQSFVAITCGVSLVAQADVVTDWNSAALKIIRENKTPPPKASRNLAILHASIYDAVNGISRSHQHYFVPSTVPSSASKEAAASAAAHKTLLALWPTNAAAFDALHGSILAEIRDGARKHMGIAWGESVA